MKLRWIRFTGAKRAIKHCSRRRKEADFPRPSSASLRRRLQSSWIVGAALLGAAALLSGCVTGNLERIATVQNRAEALYAYGGVATFPVSSELTETSIFAPVQRKHEFSIPPEARESMKPVISEKPHAPDAVAREQAPAAKAQESTTQSKDKPLATPQRTEEQKETVVAQEHAATQVEKPQTADVKQQTLAPDTQVSEHQPTFRTKVSKTAVKVGEKFEFTMEFQNSTPVDLASVQLTDPIDPRLKLFQRDIKVEPNFKHYVSVGNGQVVVKFTNELNRGKRVRVTIPVMFPATSAAAAQ